MMKMKKILIILACILCVGGCTSNKEEPIQEPTPEATINTYDDEPSYAVLDTIAYGDDFVVPFNTTIKLETLRYDDMVELNPLFQETLQKYAMYFDAYHEYEGLNNITTINNSYGKEEEIILEEDIFNILKEGINLTKLTDGKFNITVGTLFSLWKDKFSPFPVENTDPDETAINEALGCVVNAEDIDKIIELNDNNSSVIFHKYDSCNTEVKIDVGAIAKGYAIDKCRDVLSEYNKPFLINAGASSIITYVPENEHKDWMIGVRNPYARVLTLFDYTLQDSGTFTTSGDDSNYFILENGNGLIRHHILDPSTGYPNTYIKEATLVSKEKAFVSDAITTAFFNCETLEERLSLLSKVEDFYNIELSFGYFEEIVSESGNLVVDEEFDYFIVPSSISENIRDIEVIK